MYKIIKNKNVIEGKIKIPGSKSESNRCLIIKALCKDNFKIDNISESTDTNILIEALQKIQNNKSKGNILEIDINDCGTAMRFLTAFLSVKEGKYILKGKASMNKRPIADIVNSINEVGGNIKYIDKYGFPPILISGVKELKPVIKINASVSSQFISALILIAPILKNGLKIIMQNKIVSAPYIELTLSILDHFSIKYFKEKNTIIIPSQLFKAKDYSVGGDWSSASYWFEFVALNYGMKLDLQGLDINSKQADKALIGIYKNFGIESIANTNNIVIYNKKPQTNSLELTKSRKIKTFNLINTPDLFPALSINAAHHENTIKLVGLDNLDYKESKRLTIIYKTLKDIGFNLFLKNKKELIFNFTHNKNINTHKLMRTFKDHRIAMGFAPLASLYNYILLDDIEVVKKSYPNYWNEFGKLGFEIMEV